MESNNPPRLSRMGNTTLRTGLNATYNLTSRIHSRAAVYYNNSSNNQGSSGTTSAGSQDALQFTLGLNYTINRHFAAHVDYDVQLSERARGLLAKSIFRRPDVYLLRIPLRSHSCNKLSGQNRKLPSDVNLTETLHMRSSPNGAAAREPTIPVQTGNISRSALLKQRQKPSVVGLACFAVVLAAVFGPSLLTLINYAASSHLYSYILLIPFVSAYLLYIRRDQLPKKYSVDLPLAIVSIAIGLGILIFTYWLDFAGRAPAINDRLTLLTLSFLCCLAAGGFFFFGRAWMRAAAFPLAYLIFMIPMPSAMADALERPPQNTPRPK